MPLTHTHAADQVAVIAAIDPDAAGTGDQTSDWAFAGDFHTLMAVIQTGTMGTSATIDAKLQQATDSSGTGAKDISGAAISQLVKASNDDDQAIISLQVDALDLDNGFDHVAIVLSVGTATSDCSAVLLGCSPRVGPADENDLDSVVEVVRV